MTYTTQTAWKEIMNYLPEAYHFTDAYQPAEEWWDWKGNRIHLDTFRNPQAPAKIIMFHGVGINGRQISMIAGGPQSKNGFETIMIDMPTYGVTEVKDRNAITYADWVQAGVDYVNYEASKDDRPIFLYGLSAGGMETYHVAAAARNPKVKGIIGTTFLDQRNKQVRTETVDNKLTAMFGASSVAIGRKIGLGRMTLPLTQVSKMSALVNNEKLLKEVFYKDKTSAGNKASLNFLDSYMNFAPAIAPADFDVCPVLLTQPEKDYWTPEHLSAPVLDKIKKVPTKTVILPNGGHYPIEADALLVMNKAIRDFVEANM